MKETYTTLISIVSMILEVVATLPSNKPSRPHRDGACPQVIDLSQSHLANH